MTLNLWGSLLSGGPMVDRPADASGARNSGGYQPPRGYHPAPQAQGGSPMLTNAMVAPAVAGFAADVRAGLTKTSQKELPSKYLYDTVGSRLFEVISDLPEYGATRADER